MNANGHWVTGVGVTGVGVIGVDVRNMGRLSAMMLVFSVVFWMSMGYCTASDGEVIAVGDGFELTQDDVTLLREYYEKTPVRTTEEGYKEAALKIKLFVREATVLELDKDVEVPSTGKRSAEFQLKLQALYIKYIMESYPVSDLAIESYYRSFQERFATDAEPALGMTIAPMDADVKKKISAVIVDAQKIRILSETEDRLKVKYRVKIIEKQGEG